MTAAGGVSKYLRTGLCARDVSGVFWLAPALVMALGRYCHRITSTNRESIVLVDCR